MPWSGWNHGWIYTARLIDHHLRCNLFTMATGGDSVYAHTADELVRIGVALDELAPWEFREDLGESREAFHAFRHFRDLPSTKRSARSAYLDHVQKCREPQPVQPVVAQEVTPNVTPEGAPGPVPDVAGTAVAPPQHRVIAQAPGYWKQWRQRFKWDERVQLHDAFNDRVLRDMNFEVISKMNARHSAVSTVAWAKVGERLQTFDAQTLDAKDIPRWMKVSADIERRARGEAAEIIQHRVEVQVSTEDASATRARLKAMGVLRDITEMLQAQKKAGIPIQTAIQLPAPPVVEGELAADVPAE